MPTQSEELERSNPWGQAQAQGALPAVQPSGHAGAEASPELRPQVKGPAPQAATSTALSHWGEAGAKEAACANAARETVPFPPLRTGQDAAKKPAAAKPVDPSFLVDGQGRIFLAGECPVQIGFRNGAGKTFVGVDSTGKHHGYPIGLSHLGTLRLGAEAKTLLRMEEATVKTSPAKAAQAQAPAAVPGENAAAGAESEQMTPCKLTFTGRQEGMLESGEQILERSGQGFSPVALNRLPAAVKGKLDAHSRIDLSDGEMWIYMDFALAGEKTSTGRWVPPGHGKEEVAADQRLIRSEADKLPAASQVRTEVESVLRIVGLVCSVEGKFDAVSPPGDIYASLGIFQWAMPKDSSGESGSMGVFFSKLKERAQAASAKPEKERTEEDKLYVAAWEQCTKHGLEMQGQKIQMNGAAATGRTVEDEMHGEMSKGALRTYQLIAARDWIEAFRGTVVRPGPSATKWIQNGYVEQNQPGTKVKLKHGANSFVLEASAYSTVGQMFTSEQSLAYAVMLGVNRPHYVEGALWKAASTEAAPSTKCTELLTRLDGLMSRTEGKKKPAARTYTAADVEAAGEEAQAIYAQLQGLIWPAGGALSAEALAGLPAEFKSNAMQLYSPGDARQYHRERRFSTVDAAF